VVENTRRCCQAVSRGELDFAVVGGKIPTDLQPLLLVSTAQHCPQYLASSGAICLISHQHTDKDDAAPALQQVGLCYIQGTLMVAIAVERVHQSNAYLYMEAQSTQAWDCLLACDAAHT